MQIIPAGTPKNPATDWHYYLVFDTSGGPKRMATLFVRTDGEVKDRAAVNLLEHYAYTVLMGGPYILVDWKVLHRPAPTAVTVKWETDDIATLTVGDTEIALTYDELGTAGLTAVMNVIETLSTQLGVTVTTEGTPGV